MIKNALTKALDDLLALAGEDAIFHPKTGASFPLRVIYGKSSNLASFGNFSARDHEHQFFCRLSDIEGKHRNSEITFKNRTFSIEDIQTDGPAAILYGE